MENEEIKRDHDPRVMCIRMPPLWPSLPQASKVDERGRKRKSPAMAFIAAGELWQWRVGWEMMWGDRRWEGWSWHPCRPGQDDTWVGASQWRKVGAETRGQAGACPTNVAQT
jgi:hypothetical protein